MQGSLENYYVGAYWGVRKETALECARRAEVFFHMLARCDPSFAQWYRAGRGFPRELPGYPVCPEVKELEELFLRGRVRAGPGKVDVIEDLGFLETVWNAKKERTRLELYCGAYSPWGAGNACILDPPKSGEVKDRILRVPVLEEILTSMVTAWEPDFAVATSVEMLERVEKRKREVRVGWLTYLSNRLGKVPPLPEPVRVEPVGELGTLLILSPERMTARDPEHVALTVRVREVLDEAGLILIQRPEPEPG